VEASRSRISLPPESAVWRSYLAAIENAEVRKRLVDAGIDMLQSSSSEFADDMFSETAKWNAVVKSAISMPIEPKTTSGPH
jgi:hypothetical protein